MAHMTTGQGAGGGAPRGTQDRFDRWTKAREGKGTEMRFLTEGAMPKTTQRRHRVKRVK